MSRNSVKRRNVQKQIRYKAIMHTISVFRPDRFKVNLLSSLAIGKPIMISSTRKAVFEPAHSYCFWVGLCNVVIVFSGWSMLIYLLSTAITRSVGWMHRWPGGLSWVGDFKHCMHMADLVKMNSLASLV